MSPIESSDSSSAEGEKNSVRSPMANIGSDAGTSGFPEVVNTGTSSKWSDAQRSTLDREAGSVKLDSARPIIRIASISLVISSPDTRLSATQIVRSPQLLQRMVNDRPSSERPTISVL
jgi:hypothetical protein